MAYDRLTRSYYISSGCFAVGQHAPPELVDTGSNMGIEPRGKGLDAKMERLNQQFHGHLLIHIYIYIPICFIKGIFNYIYLENWVILFG